MKDNNHKPLGDIKPLRNNVIVKQDDHNHVVSNIIITTDDDRNKKPSMGTVVACGDECKQLKKGDRILFSTYSGVFFNYDNEKDLLMMQENEVLSFIINENSKIHVGDTTIYKSTEIGAASRY